MITPDEQVRVIVLPWDWGYALTREGESGPVSPFPDPPDTGVSALGPVGAAVKRGADHKTRPVWAGGDETRKGLSR